MGPQPFKHYTPYGHTGLISLVLFQITSRFFGWIEVRDSRGACRLPP